MYLFMYLVNILVVVYKTGFSSGMIVSDDLLLVTVHKAVQKLQIRCHIPC